MYITTIVEHYSGWIVPADLLELQPQNDNVGNRRQRQPEGKVIVPEKQDDPAKQNEKEKGRYPLHDEAIGGA